MSLQHWQTVTKPDLEVQWPEERESHSSSIITDLTSPILVVIGGLDNDIKTIKDCWILDINEKSWTKVYHDSHLLSIIYI